MAWGASSSEGPLLVIHFGEADTNGYLFVKILAVLIRSVDTVSGAPRKERDAFLWLVLGEIVRTMCFLFSGHVYVPGKQAVWTDRLPQGRFVPPSSEFQAIHHTDSHMCNIFLAFDSDLRIPRVLLADPELVEMDVFMQAFLGLHPRPSLAIDRKLAEIRSQMETGTTLLRLAQAGLYDECMRNFRKQEATLPVPLTASRKDLPKVFDLSKGNFSYVANLWSLRQALEGGMRYYKVLEIPRQDVSEGGEVSIARATALSMAELKKLTEHFDHGDKCPEAENAESDNDLATSELDCGVLAQEIPV